MLVANSVTSVVEHSYIFHKDVFVEREARSIIVLNLRLVYLIKQTGYVLVKVVS